MIFEQGKKTKKERHTTGVEAVQLILAIGAQEVHPQPRVLLDPVCAPTIGAVAECGRFARARRGFGGEAIETNVKIADSIFLSTCISTECLV